MVDLTQAKTSEIGKDAPLETSKQAVSDFIDDIVKDANLPESPNKRKSGETAQLGEVGSPKPLDVETEDGQTTVSRSDEKDDEEEESSESREAEDAEDDEDLIPKSKVQERIDKLTAKIKSLEVQNQQLSQKAPQTQDEKLERLSLAELKALKRQTKIAGRSETDEARFNALLDLEDKVDEMVQTYPQRFALKQIANLQVVLPELSKVDPEAAQGKGELWEIGRNIYQRSRALQASEMGQVEAMMLAAEHLSLKKSGDSGREKVSTLNRQVNQLKKKTSLEGKIRVAQEQGQNLAKLREKARTGDMIDKENYFREALVPEEFLQI